MSSVSRRRREEFRFGRARATAVSVVSCVLFAVAGVLLLPSSSASEKTSGPAVLELKLDGEVEPILATYIDEGLQDAAQRHASLVLITMDTPGGLSDSMKDMIQHILASPVQIGRASCRGRV